MPWDPRQYLRFGAERLRPAIDLLAAVPLTAAREVIDFGCGAGNVAAILKERFPAAELIGVDGSAEMLERAAQALPNAQWIRADLREWEPEEPADLVFSNATLHWLEDHPTLFRRLARMVRPGGCLAVQMPANHAEPSHTAAFEVACDDRWRARLEPHLRRSPVHALADYLAILSPIAHRLDLWETRYLHVLDGEDPVAQWTKGSLLVPLLDALEPSEREDFWARYCALLRPVYPRLPDGRTPFPFLRRFIVATF